MRVTTVFLTLSLGIGAGAALRLRSLETRLGDQHAQHRATLPEQDPRPQVKVVDQRISGQFRRIRNAATRLNGFVIPSARDSGDASEAVVSQDEHQLAISERLSHPIDGDSFHLLLEHLSAVDQPSSLLPATVTIDRHLLPGWVQLRPRFRQPIGFAELETIVKEIGLTPAVLGLLRTDDPRHVDLVRFGYANQKSIRLAAETEGADSVESSLPIFQWLSRVNARWQPRPSYRRSKRVDPLMMLAPPDPQARFVSNNQSSLFRQAQEESARSFGIGSLNLGSRIDSTVVDHWMLGAINGRFLGPSQYPELSQFAAWRACRNRGDPLPLMDLIASDRRSRAAHVPLSSSVATPAEDAMAGDAAAEDKSAEVARAIARRFARERLLLMGGRRGGMFWSDRLREIESFKVNDDNRELMQRLSIGCYIPDPKARKQLLAFSMEHLGRRHLPRLKRLAMTSAPIDWDYEGQLPEANALNIVTRQDSASAADLARTWMGRSSWPQRLVYAYGGTMIENEQALLHGLLCRDTPPEPAAVEALLRASFFCANLASAVVWTLPDSHAPLGELDEDDRSRLRNRINKLVATLLRKHPDLIKVVDQSKVSR